GRGDGRGALPAGVGLEAVSGQGGGVDGVAGGAVAPDEAVGAAGGVEGVDEGLDGGVPQAGGVAVGPAVGGGAELRVVHPHGVQLLLFQVGQDVVEEVGLVPDVRVGHQVEVDVERRRQGLARYRRGVTVGGEDHLLDVVLALGGGGGLPDLL